jgi:NADH-quinone oxidoreductase subunit E
MNGFPSPKAGGVLTEEEILEIQHEIAHYPNKKAVSIDALKIVQNRRGWISDEVLKGIADVLDMSAEELDSVATFYNLIFRRPVGRHVVFVCDSISCWVCGGEAARQKLEDKLGARLGETSADGKFTLLPICCLGACDKAPTALVDGDLHERLNDSGVDAILQRYR